MWRGGKTGAVSYEMVRFDLIAVLRAYITPYVQMYSIAEHRRVLRHRRARPSLMP